MGQVFIFITHFEIGMSEQKFKFQYAYVKFYRQTGTERAWQTWKPEVAGVITELEYLGVCGTFGP